MADRGAESTVFSKQQSKQSHRHQAPFHDTMTDRSPQYPKFPGELDQYRLDHFIESMPLSDLNPHQHSTAHLSPRPLLYGHAPSYFGAQFYRTRCESAPLTGTSVDDADTDVLTHHRIMHRDTAATKDVDDGRRTNVNASRSFRERRKQREKVLRETVFQLVQRNLLLERLLLQQGITPPPFATMQEELALHVSQRNGGPPITIPGLSSSNGGMNNTPPPHLGSLARVGEHSLLDRCDLTGQSSTGARRVGL